ncbi:MAG: T9SS type A sorting domain-containing protein [Ferruginibacter sp.]
MKKTLPLFFILVISFIKINAQLTQSFDVATFPPAGWLNLHTTGTNAAAVWERATAGAYGGDAVPNDANSPFTVDPHSGAGMASFRSYDFANGNGAHLITSAVNLSTGGPHLISFWMYRDNVYTNPDSISVYANTSQSSSGATFLGKVIRKRSLAPIENNPDGWYKYSFNIPSGFNTATNYFIFSAVSSFGNNMFIDDVVVASQPSCSSPTNIRATAYNHGTGTATGNWTASTSATVSGYEWVVNTTGTTPASAGTSVPGITANITGITPDMVNYLFVRTTCGAGNFSTWSSVSFAALPCATLVAPNNAATNVAVDQVFSWTAVGGATAYNFYLGIAAGNEINLGSVTSTSATVGQDFLAPGQTYYWYIVPVFNGVSAPNVGCTARSFTVRPAPSNNPCGGATVINAGNTSGNVVNSTTLGATQSLDSASCTGFNNGMPDDDVWFQFTTSATTPPAGTLTFTPTATGGITDIVVQVYAGATCATVNTSPVACVDVTEGAATEVLDLSLLSPNTHYYMRVFSWDDVSSSSGAFTIIASAGNTLPVSLATFVARRSNKVNILNWSTQQEVNTNYFVIERSNDGVNFISIGQVIAAGNSIVTHNYSFTDLNPLKGNNYYRLRTIDRDNTAKLSDTRRIRNEGIADIKLYPNPISSNLTVEINADKKTDGNLTITDISGKQVYTRSLKLQQGITTLPLVLNNMADGSYILKIQLEDDVIVRKFNKQ